MLDNTLYGIIIVSILVFIAYDNKMHIREYFTATVVVSEFDDRPYRVVGGFEDRQVAANKLSQVHRFMIEVMRHLRKKFIIQKYGTNAQQKFVSRVLENYRPDVLFENDPSPGEETSYVMNKGEKFGVCLREKNKDAAGEFHDESTMQFVALHEMSHLGSVSYGHNDEFWNWFKFMLVEAKEAGLHIPVDYSKTPISYCGMPVKNNPYYI